MNPYYAGSGTTFQSDPSSGPSHPITVRFSRAVTAVTVTIYDPDYEGNRMVAYDARGVQVQTVGFTGDNTPGVLTSETQVLSTTGIRRVDLIPSTGIAQGDYVWYELSFTPDDTPQPPCPVTRDPQLDDPVNSQKMDSSFQVSNPNGPQLERKEHFRAGYSYPDGHVESIDYNINATNCESSDFSFPVELVDGGLLAWIWHSHPYTPGELVPQCLGRKPFNTPQPYQAAPSDADWKKLDEANYQLFLRGKPPVPGYIWDKSRVIRMAPNVIGETPRFDSRAFDRAAC